MSAGLRRPRWVQRGWARLWGYFWLPCPECGRLFGGHEMAPNLAAVSTPDGEFVVCRACGPTVGERNLAAVRARLRGLGDAP